MGPSEAGFPVCPCDMQSIRFPPSQLNSQLRNADVWSDSTTPHFEPVASEKSIGMVRGQITNLQRSCTGNRKNEQKHEEELRVTCGGPTVQVLESGKEFQRKTTATSRDADAACVYPSMDDGANQATDLINKPKQKPERKKHRPEVITERKSRTQKIAEKNDGSNETPRIEIKHANPCSTPGTSEVQAINHKKQEQSDSKEVATFKRKYVRRSTVPTSLLEENEASVDARTIGSGNMEKNQGSVRKNLSKHARSKMSTPRKVLVVNQEMAGDDEDEVELQEISRLRSGKRSIKEANLQAAKKSVSDASYHAMIDRLETKMVESRKHGNAEVLDDSRSSQASTVCRKQESNFESTGGSKLKFQHNHHYSRAELLQLADDSIRGAFNNQGNAGKSSMVYGGENQTANNQHGKSAESNNRFVASMRQMKKLEKPALVGEEAKNYPDMNDELLHIAKGDENLGVHFQSNLKHARASTLKEQRNHLQQSQSEDLGNGSKLKVQDNYSFAKLLRLADSAILDTSNNQGNAGKSSLVYGAESQTDTSSNQHGKSAQSKSRFVAESVRHIEKLEKPALVGDEAKNYPDMNDELLHIAKGDENLGVHFQSNLKNDRASTPKEQRNHLQQSQAEDRGNGSKLKFQPNHNYSRAELLQLADDSIRGAFNDQGNGKF